MRHRRPPNRQRAHLALKRTPDFDFFLGSREAKRVHHRCIAQQSFCEESHECYQTIFHKRNDCCRYLCGNGLNCFACKSWIALTDRSATDREEAYIYGYSLMTTEVTRVQMSNVAKLEGLTGPVGQFINVPRYPPADYRGVSAPNADTLYSIGWVDLTEPQVFSHPDMGSRYYLSKLPIYG